VKKSNIQLHIKDYSTDSTLCQVYISETIYLPIIRLHALSAKRIDAYDTADKCCYCGYCVNNWPRPGAITLTGRLNSAGTGRTRQLEMSAKA
jgi:hypothetical protein